jgi:uncharacterized protein (TIGR02611 family)
MFAGIKAHWEDLKAGRPGHRFQDHYKKRHETHSSPWRKILFLGGGALIAAAGIFFLPAPGPGFLIIFLGGGLMAQESRVAARVLDWCELRVRAVIDWAVGIWQRAGVPVRVAIVLLAAGVAAGAGYLAYEVFLNKG